MNKSDYKRAFDTIEPDAHLGQRIAQNLAGTRQPNSFGRKRTVILSVSVSLVVAACAWMLVIADFGGGSTPSVPPEQTVADGSVFIPKIELPKKTNAAMDMVGLFIYQGRIYTQTSSHISPEAAQAVLGEKVGRTKGNIDEWSSQKDYAKELASSIGEQDIFTVKGYDSNFRLMTYQVADGQIWTEFYECLNGISISSGADVLQKLNIIGNEQAVKWESFDSWNYDKKQYQQVPLNETLQKFLEALNAAKPIEAKQLIDQGIYSEEGQSRKFLLFTLKDQSEVRLDLHQGGYVRYAPADVFFKLDDAAFTAVWEMLK
ncbi:hypothetical protein [Paenibacillus mendelii]|uniref:DUF3298 domain-containing protein n=1 Tax=Paenibacillus mendelii TaxID=206163 RepID=A0ABV6JE26_9BACL|nr:hypothetical protein [Paenibacillus mendelii]MCQ6563845.1 hypothetical protein [Paenibacillus mendelii]